MGKIINYFILVILFSIFWVSVQLYGYDNDFIFNSKNVVCNPINLNYRYMPDTPSRREAADPTVVVYKNDYYLFASKSGGYWWSSDLVKWYFVKTNQIPTEDYAPAAIVINDTLYFIASSTEKNPILRSTDPKSGHWEVVRQSLPFAVWDPSFFYDDEKRLYLYWGCSNQNPLYGIELDYNRNFEPIGTPTALVYPNTHVFGWENPGDSNQLTLQAPWIEGPFMNKVNGIYYLQYAAPGTEFKSYCDAVYVSKNPLGPFVIQKINPFSLKPFGFVAGAGHGSTFQDKYGNWWHIATSTISVNHMFERRLSMFPVFFVNNSMYAFTLWGDYPCIVPTTKVDNPLDLITPWNILSYMKKVTASSSLKSSPAVLAVDEDIRTWWCASSNAKGEWLAIDLDTVYDVYAIQVNLSDQSAKLFSHIKDNGYQYLLDYSTDSINWLVLCDKTNNSHDLPHDFVVLEKSVKARYIRFVNYYTPSQFLALSDFRVFGKGKGLVPQKVSGVIVNRFASDRRRVALKWNAIDNATGYLVLYGYDQDTLVHYYRVYKKKSLEIRSLNATHAYYFCIIPFNENGIGNKSNILFVP